MKLSGFCFLITICGFAQIVISLENSTTTDNNLDKAANLTFVLSARNLPKKDRYSDVDAFVKLFHRKGQGQNIRFGTTDRVYDNKNPEWHQVWWFDWEKGTEQKWHFVIRDHDRLAIDDPVGDVTVDVDDYVARGQDINASLSGGGHLIIKRTQPFTFRLSASNIPSKDGDNGKSDAYVKMYFRQGKNGPTNLFRKSAVVHDAEFETNFNYQEIEFSNWQKGTNQYLYFQLYDRDAFTTDDFIGDLQVDADELVANKTMTKVPLEHSDGKVTLSIYTTK